MICKLLCKHAGQAKLDVAAGCALQEGSELVLQVEEQGPCKVSGEGPQ